VRSVADQSGRTMTYKFFTKEGYECFKNKHMIVGEVAAAAATKKERIHRQAEEKEEEGTAGAPSAAAVAPIGVAIDETTLEQVQQMPYKAHRRGHILRGPSASKKEKIEPSVTPSTASAVAAATPLTADSISAAAAVASATTSTSPDITRPVDSILSSPSAPPSPSLTPLPLSSPESVSQTSLIIGSKAPRATLIRAQRESWALECLNASSDGMVRASTVARYVMQKEMALRAASLTTDDGSQKQQPSRGKVMTLENKSSMRLWNHLEQSGKVFKLSIGVNLHTGGMKNVVILLKPEVMKNLPDPEVRAKAVAIARGEVDKEGKENEEDEEKAKDEPPTTKRKRARRSRATVPQAEQPEEAAAGQEQLPQVSPLPTPAAAADTHAISAAAPAGMPSLEQPSQPMLPTVSPLPTLAPSAPLPMTDEQLVAAAAMEEEEERQKQQQLLLQPSPPVASDHHVPRLRRDRRMKHSPFSDIESDSDVGEAGMRSDADVETDEGVPSQNVLNAENAFRVSLGYLAPVLARVRWMMERMWTIYAHQEPGVKPTNKIQRPGIGYGEKIEGEDEEKGKEEEEKKGDTAEADSAPSAIHYPFFMHHMFLLDWATLVGLREEDLLSPFEGAAIMNEPNLSLPISHPTIAAKMERMLKRDRYKKTKKIRLVFDKAEMMGLITEAEKVDDKLTEVEGAIKSLSIGANRGYYMLTPRMYMLGRSYDMRSKSGRDEFWTTIKEQAIAVHKSRWRESQMMRLTRYRARSAADRAAKKKAKLSATNEGVEDTGEDEGPGDDAEEGHGTGIDVDDEHADMPRLESPFEASPTPEPSTTDATRAEQTVETEAAVSSAATAISQPVPKKRRRGPLRLSQTTPLLPTHFPILSVFPLQRFSFLYNVVHWTLGPKLPSEIVEKIRSVMPPVPHVIPTSTQIRHIGKRILGGVRTSLVAAVLAMQRFQTIAHMYETMELFYIPAAREMLTGAVPLTHATSITAREHVPSRPSTSSAAAAAATSSAHASQAPSMTSTMSVPTDVELPQLFKEKIDAARDNLFNAERQKPPTRKHKRKEKAGTQQQEGEGGMARHLTSGGRFVVTRQKWTPAEDERLKELYRAWLQEYVEFHKQLQRSSQNHTPAGSPWSSAEKKQPRPSFPVSNQYIAERMVGRDRDAIRRRVNHLCSINQLPLPSTVLTGVTAPARTSVGEQTDAAAAGTAAAPTAPSPAPPAVLAPRTWLGFSHLSSQVFPHPISVSIFSMIKLLLAQPRSIPWDSRVSRLLLTPFDSKLLDDVTDAMRADRWIALRRTTDNQMGNKYKLGAGWSEAMKPYPGAIALEVFQVSQQLLNKWAKNHAATIVSAQAQRKGKESKEVTIQRNAHGGDLAAVLSMLHDGRVRLKPHVYEEAKEPAVAAVVQNVPPYLSTIDEAKHSNLPALPPVPVDASAASSAAASSPPLSFSFLSSHLSSAFPSLHRIQPALGHGNEAGGLSEAELALLMPVGYGDDDAMHHSQDGEEEVEMRDQDEDEDVIMQSGNDQSVSSAAHSSSSSSSSSSNEDDNKWLDASEVVAAQADIVRLLLTADKEGLSLPTLQASFRTLRPDLAQIDQDIPSLVDFLSTPLRPTSSIFHKSLSRACNYLDVIRVSTYESVERFIHREFALLWCLPTFHIKDHAHGQQPPRMEGMDESQPHATVEADYRSTAIVAHPWRLLDGGVNESLFQAFRQTILSHLLSRPGITFSTLQHVMPGLSPSELRQCLQLLCMEGKIHVVRQKKEQVSLFSKLDDASGSDKKKRKRRKMKHNGAAAAAQMEMEIEDASEEQEYFFPTPTAFI